MIKTFRKIHSIKAVYTGNSILYYLMRLPLIGKLFPYSLYKSPACKMIVNIIGIIAGIVKIFLFKPFYLLIISGITGMVMGGNATSLSSNDIFVNLFFWFTIGGCIGNCYVLIFQKEHEYAITYLRMNTKKVVLTGFFEFLLGTFIGFLPMFLFYPSLNSLSLLTFLSLFVILICGKIVGGAFRLFIISRKLSFKQSDGTGSSYILIALCISAIGIGFNLMGISLSEIVLLSIALFFLVLSVFSLLYLLKSNNYHKLYKKMMTQTLEMLANPKATAQKAQFKTSQKYIQMNLDIDTKKTGYAFLSECFMKRHKKLMFNTTRIYIIIESLLVTAAIVAVLVFPDISEKVNLAVISLLPFFTYLMCFSNCGERAMRVYFMNCDNEFLLYRFYRQPKAILKMFTLRLKSIILLDYLQSLPIAIGLPLILFVSGGTDSPINYLILFVSIAAMSTFFSVNNLVIYYLFQPYNKDVQMKNPIYTALKAVTYFGCYILMQVNPPFESFALILIAFSLAYVLISIPTAYKVAPKTFKLK